MKTINTTTDLNKVDQQVKENNSLIEKKSIDKINFINNEITPPVTTTDKVNVIKAYAEHIWAELFDDNLSSNTVKSYLFIKDKNTWGKLAQIWVWNDGHWSIEYFWSNKKYNAILWYADTSSHRWFTMYPDQW